MFPFFSLLPRNFACKRIVFSFAKVHRSALADGACWITIPSVPPITETPKCTGGERERERRDIIIRKYVDDDAGWQTIKGSRHGRCPNIVDCVGIAYTFNCGDFTLLFACLSRCTLSPSFVSESSPKRLIIENESENSKATCRREKMNVT